MTDVAQMAERVWYGRDAIASVARVALAPAALVYGAAARARAALYDVGALASQELALPSISVGNITVGGTGKTPVAAWIARQLQQRGATPAIVMRGYGDDEPLVHARLTPGAHVVCDADRVRGVLDAQRLGATVAVLDDAFQHRRARRNVDLVLVSAERAETPVRLLPRGPYREPLSALQRASAIIVTRKSASRDAAHGLAERLQPLSDVPVAIAALLLDEVRAWDGDDAQALNSLDGREVLAIAAIGNPHAFMAQLTARGAGVHDATFPDHHAFSASDVTTLAQRAARVGRVVCTLKDAVKLGPMWPRLAPPLWYVSQRVALEEGATTLDQLLNDLPGLRRPF